MSEVKPAPQKDGKTGRFLPGNNGGPGRPRGARSTLEEMFLRDMQEAWKEGGRDALERMMRDEPGGFVRAVVSLMPKEATLNINDNSQLSDEELAERISYLAERLAPFLAERDAGAGPGVEAPERKAIASRVH